MDLLGEEIYRSFVFVTQVLVGDRYEESMASVFFLPSVASQFSHVKGLVDEEIFKSKMRHSSSWDESMFETECLLMKPRLMK